MKTAIYIRVSTTHQIDKDSLPMQRKDLIAYTEMILQIPDYEIFEDAGYSGKNTDRPAFREMMDRIKKKEFTHLLVWKIDRISRNLLDFATMYSELKSLGVTFVSKNEQFDTSNAMGEAMLKIILVFAELERNMTSERVTATMLSRAGNGFWNGGKIPYGYSYDPKEKCFSIDSGESQTVLFMYQSYRDGASLPMIAKQLNAKGIQTRNGNQWSANTVYVIVTNPFYLGTYRYNTLVDSIRQNQKDESEWIVIHNHHPAIVDKSLFDSVQTRLAECHRTYTRMENRPHIFKGKLICGECGSRLLSSIAKADRNGLRLSVYSCPSRRNESGLLCRGTSDSTVGEFFFNYVLRMMNIQKNPERFPDLESIQEYLLEGTAFDYIDSIEESSLRAFQSLVGASLEPDPYTCTPKVNQDTQSQIQRLQTELKNKKRALKRLSDLYLYDDTSMSKSSYIVSRTEIVEDIESLEKQISVLESSDLGLSMDDAEFMKCASTFILTQKLTSRSYANFKNLCLAIDHQVLQDFVDKICDNIVIKDGKVQSITFRNGLQHSFIYKENWHPSHQK